MANKFYNYLIFGVLCVSVLGGVAMRGMLHVR